MKRKLFAVHETQKYSNLISTLLSNLCSFWIFLLWVKKWLFEGLVYWEQEVHVITLVFC